MYSPAKVKNIQGWIFNSWRPYKAQSETDNMMLTLANHYEASGYLSARILNYITEYNINLIDRLEIQKLIDSLPEKPFTVVSTHDCFRVHPRYGNDIREQYLNQLKLIEDSSLLSFLLSQHYLTYVPVNKGKITVNGVYPIN